jgi:hypothetical protein
MEPPQEPPNRPLTLRKGMAHGPTPARRRQAPPGPALALSHTLALLLCVLLAPPLATPVRAGDAEVDVKAAYLFNFTRFIEWPETAMGEVFVIAVVGDPALAAALRTVEQRGKRAQGRPIQVRTGDGAVAGSHILFIGTAAVPRLARLLRATAERPVLVVGDSPGLARRGVAINFFLQRDVLGEGRRLRFEINPENLKGRGLTVSAQLFDVAEILR